MTYPGLLHPEPLPLQQSAADPYLQRRHSNTVLSQSLWGSLGPGITLRTKVHLVKAMVFPVAICMNVRVGL